MKTGIAIRFELSDTRETLADVPHHLSVDSKRWFQRISAGEVSLETGWRDSWVRRTPERRHVDHHQHRTGVR